MSKRREDHSTEQKNGEKFFESRKKSGGKEQPNFRPDPDEKGPPEPVRRRKSEDSK